MQHCNRAACTPSRLFHVLRYIYHTSLLRQRTRRTYNSPVAHQQHCRSIVLFFAGILWLASLRFTTSEPNIIDNIFPSLLMIVCSVVWQGYLDRPWHLVRGTPGSAD